MKHLLVLVLTCCLSACTSIAIPTALKLDRLDPLTANPTGFVVQARFDPELRVTPGAEELSFTITRGATGEVFGGPQPLRILHGEDGIVTYALTREAAETLRDLQAKAATWPKDGQNSLSMNFTFDACLATADAAPEFSVAIRLAEDAAFLLLLRSTPMAKVLEEPRLCS
ncbi:MAG: hypothetical protein MK180_15885 [Rhodobacteraceae bacterium]|nr:hypothetical protein [Paracoccaceae bacterium]